MKLACLVDCLLYGFCFSYQAAAAAAAAAAATAAGKGQFEDPPDYTTIVFEPVHRGTFNMSKCSRDLINCWATVPPEVFCKYQHYSWLGGGPYKYASICDIMHKYCANDGYEYHDYEYIFRIREQSCMRRPSWFKKWSTERYTRRQFADTDYMLLLPTNLALQHPPPGPNIHSEKRGAV